MLIIFLAIYFVLGLIFVLSLALIASRPTPNNQHPAQQGEIHHMQCVRSETEAPFRQAA